MVPGRGSEGEAMPPIEIGSFVALQPDKSEFIGSASGVFFANTVFRAFSELRGSQLPVSRRDGDDGASPNHPSAHGLLTASDHDSEEPHPRPDCGPETVETQSRLSYGVYAVDLGLPPRPEIAKELLMTYFRKWHPFFPFLHGPSFMEQVHDFYSQDETNETDATTGTTSHASLCRAVIFQCVFHLGECLQNSHKSLPAQSRIRTASLMDVVPALARGNDTSALQAMLAIELCLLTQMSLRSASIVHGTLVRVVYNCGFHRCPYRYVQLPAEVRDLRQRIFWCTYVLDRQISQGLGHPLAIRDLEVDVCMPGLGELHKPVSPEHTTSTLSQQNRGDEVRAHLPHVSRCQSNDPSTSAEQLDDTMPQTVQSQPNTDSSEHTLSYMAQYSRLVGSALELFHMSIDNRSITMLKVQKLTYRIHSWWNSLPSALQNEGTELVAASGPRYDIFFTVMYHYLILFINRPFLSLPPCSMEFKSCLQNALSAALAILHKLKGWENHSMLYVFSSTLSAVWMSGLVVAFASIKELYPIAKGTVALNDSITILSALQHWPSSRHCSKALEMLLVRLQSHCGLRRTGTGTRRTQPATRLGSDDPDFDNGVIQTTPKSTAGNMPRNKRRRLTEVADGSDATAQFDQNHRLGGASAHLVQPVLEYTGPDFGFDASVLAAEDDGRYLPDHELSFSLDGLFDHAEWDAYVSSLDMHLSL